MCYYLTKLEKKNMLTHLSNFGAPYILFSLPYFSIFSKNLKNLKNKLV